MKLHFTFNTTHGASFRIPHIIRSFISHLTYTEAHFTLHTPHGASFHTSHTTRSLISHFTHHTEPHFTFHTPHGASFHTSHTTRSLISHFIHQTEPQHTLPTPRKTPHVSNHSLTTHKVTRIYCACPFNTTITSPDMSEYRWRKGKSPRVQQVGLLREQRRGD